MPAAYSFEGAAADALARAAAAAAAGDDQGATAVPFVPAALHHRRRKTAGIDDVLHAVPDEAVSAARPPAARDAAQLLDVHVVRVVLGDELDRRAVDAGRARRADDDVELFRRA